MFPGQFVGERARVVARVQDHQRGWGAQGLPAGGGQVCEQMTDLAAGDLGVVVAGGQAAGLDRVDPGRGAPADTDQDAEGVAG
nr:hypothetical protein [Frankia sp. Cj5]